MAGDVLFDPSHRLTNVFDMFGVGDLGRETVIDGNEQEALAVEPSGFGLNEAEIGFVAKGPGAAVNPNHDRSSSFERLIR